MLSDAINAQLRWGFFVAEVDAALVKQAGTSSLVCCLLFHPGFGSPG
jgi:hypothetical protein